MQCSPVPIAIEISVGVCLLAKSQVGPPGPLSSSVVELSAQLSLEGDELGACVNEMATTIQCLKIHGEQEIRRWVISSIFRKFCEIL
jgi:hypothetical protein